MEFSITVSHSPPLNQLLKLIFCVLTHQNPQTINMHFAAVVLALLVVVAAVSAGVYGPVGYGVGAVGYGLGGAIVPAGVRTYHGAPLINGYYGGLLG
ncbi:unnamed protein product [Orchesella dallaii]|uniref:Uncharacterized protein n=1 Tax=Orchesella dallaii TaxID=48710 RepID=A0ABP1R9S6_9HEXA